MPPQNCPCSVGTPVIGRVEQESRGQANEGHGHRKWEGDEQKQDLIPTPSSDMVENLGIAAHKQLKVTWEGSHKFNLHRQSP